ncbi:DMT family transporter [Candidatus Microgenomates bacterium]|nr:DMT family transporter [Candidatus Microgenomates bacterium]
MKGIRFALIAAVISGFSIFINKLAVTGINPLTFTATKNFGVGLLIVSVLIFTRKISLIKSLSVNQIAKLIVIGVIGGSLPFYLFFTGLSQTSAVNAAIIQKTLVIWVAILAPVFLKEKISLFSVGAVALLFYANTMVGGFKKFSFSQGEIMIFVATVLWAIETVVAKKALREIDVDLVTASRMGFGSIILLTAAGGLHPLSLNQFYWVAITAVILFCYVSFWYRALKYSPAVSVTAVLVLSTLITNLLSAKIDVSQMLIMSLAAGLLLLELYWSKILSSFALLWSKA